MKVYYLLGAAMLSLAYAHPMLGASTPATTQDACGVRGSISLDTLPAELIEKIVSHLEATQLLQVAATSHKLATVTMNAPTATHELANAYYRRIFSDTTDPHSISPVTGRTVNDFFELPPPVRVAKFYALLPAYHSFLCNVFYRRLVVQSTEYLGITPIGNIYKAARPHFLIPWFRNQLGWATYPLAQETPMEGIILGIEYLGSAADYTQQFQAQGMPMAADMAQILHASLPRLRKIHHSAQVLPLDPRFTPTRQLPAVRSDVVAYAMSTGETEFLANLAIYFTSSDFRCTLIEYLECIIAEEDLVLAYNLMLLTNTVGGKNLQPLSVATRHPVEDKAEALGRHLAAFVNTDFMDDVATALVGRGNLRGLQDFNERLSQSQVGTHPDIRAFQARLDQRIVAVSAVAQRPADLAAYLPKLTYVGFLVALATLRRQGFENAARDVQCTAERFPPAGIADAHGSIAYMSMGDQTQDRQLKPRRWFANNHVVYFHGSNQALSYVQYDLLPGWVKGNV